MDSRTKLFISYSHKDIRWLEALKEQLAVLERERLLDVYEDTQLCAGEKWYDRLHAEMSTAKVGLLLISAPFLSSDFIRNEEVPKLFNRHENGGMFIYPLLVRPCPWKAVDWLSKLQVRPQDAMRRTKAISAYSGAARDQVLADVASEIASLVKEPNATNSQSAILDAEKFDSIVPNTQQIFKELKQSPRSFDSQVRTPIEFRNSSDKIRRVYWINYEGNAVLYATLRSGEHYRSDTYLSHPWLVTDEHDNIVTLHYPELKNTVVNV